MYTVEGKTSVKVEISGQDALGIAFEVWKESVGRKGWACLGKRWAKTSDDHFKRPVFEDLTDSEKNVNELFDNLFEFLNNRKGETK
jgi:hypothetical protein